VLVGVFRHWLAFVDISLLPPRMCKLLYRYSHFVSIVHSGTHTSHHLGAFAVSFINPSLNSVVCLEMPDGWNFFASIWRSDVRGMVDDMMSSVFCVLQ